MPLPSAGQPFASSDSLDINRDHATSSQPESRAVRDVVIATQPLVMLDEHGYTGTTLIEPGTPPHGQNYEYDLYIRHALPNALGMEKAVQALGYPETAQVDIPFRDYAPGDWDDRPADLHPDVRDLPGRGRPHGGDPVAGQPVRVRDPAGGGVAPPVRRQHRRRRGHHHRRADLRGHQPGPAARQIGPRGVVTRGAPGAAFNAATGLLPATAVAGRGDANGVQLTVTVQLPERLTLHAVFRRRIGCRSLGQSATTRTASLPHGTSPARGRVPG
jgi:hypothetical protein